MSLAKKLDTQNCDRDTHRDTHRDAHRDTHQETNQKAEPFTDEASVTGTLNLPTDLESDEPPLETDLHLRQILLLISCLDWLWQDRNDFFASGNLTIYYNPQKIKSRDFRGPDFFVVLETERRTRKSLTVWEENGKYPNVIIEILSDSTAKEDRGKKKELYQNTFQTPEYFWFDPITLEFAGFVLTNGQYQPIQPNAIGHLWSQQLKLFLGVHEEKLRYFSAMSELILLPEEAAKAAQQQALQAQQQVEIERQRGDEAIAKLTALEAQLRAAGIEPNL